MDFECVFATPKTAAYFQDNYGICSLKKMHPAKVCVCVPFEDMGFLTDGFLNRT